jgi:hypothetical protein
MGRRRPDNVTEHRITLGDKERQLVSDVSGSIMLNNLVRPIGGAAVIGLGAMGLYMLSQKWELLLFKGPESVTTKGGKVIDNPVSDVPVVGGLFGLGMKIGVAAGLGDPKTPKDPDEGDVDADDRSWWQIGLDAAANVPL